MEDLMSRHRDGPDGSSMMLLLILLAAFAFIGYVLLSTGAPWGPTGGSQ